ncbi:MAG: dihydroorotase [Alphaproteobacteria bacterium]|nr:dihydroorotase [Alphaproteobacteria bacterium]MBU6473031.1 dihydroorotase [Alphaproteobacteria bacterium]MDE2011605.1 dihydroorotase [Alphaproteobacteria bacterium]MDE2071951.1 dihydroorotase [Alphaproteobacteria bacterium]MDE2351135.1 dihydroorotase [Alphaproteobacteria bacterium]
MTRTAFLNARLIDPASGLDELGALLVEDGKIADFGSRLFADGKPDCPTVDCKGHVLAPGLIDMRVFTGEPGSEHRETLGSASEAAAAGGVTTMVVMPNTDPVIDAPSLVDFITRRAAATARVRVLPMAALTRGLAGETMTEIGLLMEAGAVAFGDGDRTIANARVMRRALSYASNFDALVVGHAEDPALTEGTAMTEGEFAMRLGVSAAPAIAETIIVERDIRLVELTGARYHLGQISCKSALEAVIAAKARGLPITCAVSAHHLALNELDVASYLTFRKVKPPLRSEADRAAMVAGVAEGAIDVIVSSHDPQAADTKRQTFAHAAFGAVGLETLLPVVLGLYHDGRASLANALKTVTAAPAAILGLDAGRLAKGAPADLALIDPDAPYILEPSSLHSRALNTPFEDRRFMGYALATFVGGECVYDRAKEAR